MFPIFFMKMKFLLFFVFVGCMKTNNPTIVMIFFWYCKYMVIIVRTKQRHCVKTGALRISYRAKK